MSDEKIITKWLPIDIDGKEYVIALQFSVKPLILTPISDAFFPSRMVNNVTIYERKIDGLGKEYHEEITIIPFELITNGFSKYAEAIYVFKKAFVMAILGEINKDSLVTEKQEETK